jgi:hypothetical protein
MYDVLYNWQLWVVVVLLMGAIWVKVQVERHRSYQEGVIKGFLSGVGFTVQVVADKHLIENPVDKDIPLTEEELIRMLSPMLTKELLKNDKPRV